MGMYDSVYINCPKCGEEVEFQSKAGDRNLSIFKLNDVPASVAGDLDGDIERCKCGATLKIYTQFLISVGVQ